MDALRRVVQSLRLSARAAEARLGLSGAQLFVLQKLSVESDLSVNELAERTLTHQSSVSVVASKLVEKGLVSRVVSAKDARRLELSITPAGRAMLRKSPMAAQERLLDGLAKLSERDRGQLAMLMDRLTEVAGMSEQDAHMFFDSASSDDASAGGATTAAAKRGGRRNSANG
ncbi:MAG TPA: MarR family winged helix-turn-helix transcriptional regulator [Tepidisphaeraceae bacterium]|jgi:DNA-binding MarR family transcriptional regulator